MMFNSYHFWFTNAWVFLFITFYLLTVNVDCQQKLSTLQLIIGW